MSRRLILATVLMTLGATPLMAAEVVVFAASSLKTALDQVAADWQAQTGNTVTISYAGSNTLANQIIQGAPADIFLSAAENWMDAVEQAGLTVPDTQVDLLGNALVLVAHGKADPVTIDGALDLPALLAGGKLAMGMVDSVPAGQYGKEALETLGLWSKVEGSVAQSENVRAALALVAAGEAPLGIVYASDAMAEPGVTVIGTFPEESHKPILYPAALLTNAADEADRDFLKALSGDAADATFGALGFAILN